MIINLAEADPGALECQLCIAGAGAAGLSIALQLLGRAPRSVVVLEAGGLGLSARSQEIYAGRIVGLPYESLDAARLRYFGGTTNHWAGWCRPLDPSDLAERPWVPRSGWPIGPEDLAPYRARAHDILDLGPVDYDASPLQAEPAALFDLDPSVLVHKLWRLSPPTRFREKYAATFARADAVTVVLNASLVDIRLVDGGTRVQAFRALGPEGKRLTVTARCFVLALGGLETPRLLLNANGQTPNGVGNDHGLVGRCFMEHAHTVSARVVVPRTIGTGALYTVYRPQAQVVPAVCPSEEAQRRNGILNHSARFRLRSFRETAAGYRGLAGAAESLGEFDLEEAWQNVGELIADIDGAAHGLYNKLVGRSEFPPQQVEVLSQCEQAPDPDSRVVLLRERDRLGLHRIALDWRLGELEKRTVRVAGELLGRELRRIGVGGVQLANWLDAGSGAWGATLAGGNHHMGTTRMADDPRSGVVDRDCRVHGTANLYVAGSSVFPTSGFANPTLTIVELALRLADTLADVCRRSA